MFILERLEELRATNPALQLFALIDGAQFEMQRNSRIDRQAGFSPLFAGTKDASLAAAGPWLVDIEQVSGEVLTDICALEHSAPAVIWLITVQDLTGLSQLLQLQLDAELPDGRKALLRFWDPRVLFHLAELLDGEQRVSFFGHINEWHFLHNKQRLWVGRQHA